MVDNIGKVGSISLITSMKIMEKRLVEGRVPYKTMIASLVLVSIRGGRVGGGGQGGQLPFPQFFKIFTSFP